MKKLLTLLFAMAVVWALSMPVFAQDQNTNAQQTTGQESAPQKKHHKGHKKTKKGKKSKKGSVGETQAPPPQNP